MTKSDHDTLKRRAKIQRKMMELDPDTMAEVMAFNSTALEYDIKPEPKLEAKYRDLFKRAKKIVEEEL